MVPAPRELPAHSIRNSELCGSLDVAESFLTHRTAGSVSARLFHIHA